MESMRRIVRNRAVTTQRELLSSFEIFILRTRDRNCKLLFKATQSEAKLIKKYNSKRSDQNIRQSTIVNQNSLRLSSL